MISKQQPLSHNDVSKPVDSGYQEQQSGSATSQTGSGNGQLSGQIKQGGNTAQEQISKSGANVGGVDNKTLGTGAAGAGAVGAAGVSHYEQRQVSTDQGTYTQTSSSSQGTHPQTGSTSQGTYPQTGSNSQGTYSQTGTTSQGTYPQSGSTQSQHSAAHHGSAVNTGHSGVAGAGAGAGSGTTSAGYADSKVDDSKHSSKHDSKHSNDSKDAKHSSKDSSSSKSKDSDHSTAKPKSEKELAQEQYKGATTIDELQGMPGVPHKSELVDLGDAKKGPVLGGPDYDCTPRAKAEGPGKDSSTREATLSTYAGHSGHEGSTSSTSASGSHPAAHSEHLSSNHPTREVPTHGPKPVAGHDQSNHKAAANPLHESNKDSTALGAGAGAGTGAAAGHTTRSNQDYTAHQSTTAAAPTSGRTVGNVQEPAFASTANAGASNYEGVPQQSAAHNNYSQHENSESQPGVLAAAGAAVAGALGLGGRSNSNDHSSANSGYSNTASRESTNLPSTGTHPGSQHYPTSTTERSFPSETLGASTHSASHGSTSAPGYPSETVGTTGTVGSSSTEYPSQTTGTTSHSHHSGSQSQGLSSGNNDKLAGQIKQGGSTAQEQIGKSGASVGGVDNKTLGAGAAGAGALGAAGATHYGNSHSHNSSSQPTAQRSFQHSSTTHGHSHSHQPNAEYGTSQTSDIKPVKHSGHSQAGYPSETTGTTSHSHHSSQPTHGSSTTGYPSETTGTTSHSHHSGSHSQGLSSGNNDKLAGQIKQGGSTAQEQIGKSGASVGGVDNKTLGAGAAGAGALGAAGASHYGSTHGSSGTSNTHSTPSTTRGSGSHPGAQYSSQPSQGQYTSSSSQPGFPSETVGTLGQSHSSQATHGSASTGYPTETTGHSHHSGAHSGAHSQGLSSGNNDKLAGQIKQGGSTAQEQIGKSGASVGGVDNKTLGAGAAGAGALGAAGASHYGSTHGSSGTTSSQPSSATHASGSHSQHASGVSSHGSTGHTSHGTNSSGGFEGPFNTQGHSAAHELNTHERQAGTVSQPQDGTFGHSHHSGSTTGAGVAGAGAAGAGVAAGHHHAKSSTPAHSTQAPIHSQPKATSHAATSAHHSTQSDAQGGHYVTGSNTNAYEQSPQYAQGATHTSSGRAVSDANGEPMQEIHRSESSESRGPLATIAGALGLGGASKTTSHDSNTASSQHYNKNDYSGIGSSTSDEYRSGSGHQSSGLASGVSAKHQPLDGVPLGAETRGNSYKTQGTSSDLKHTSKSGSEIPSHHLPEQRLPEEPVSGVAGQKPVELRTAGNGPIKYQ